MTISPGVNAHISDLAERICEAAATTEATGDDLKALLAPICEAWCNEGPIKPKTRYDYLTGKPLKTYLREKGFPDLANALSAPLTSKAIKAAQEKKRSALIAKGLVTLDLTPLLDFAVQGIRSDSIPWAGMGLAALGGRRNIEILLLNRHQFEDAGMKPIAGRGLYPHVRINRLAKWGLPDYEFPILGVSAEEWLAVREKVASKVASWTRGMASIKNKEQKMDNEVRNPGMDIVRSTPSLWPLLGKFADHTKTNFTPHAFRKTYVALWFHLVTDNEGFNYEFVKNVLGHRTLDAAKQYVLMKHVPGCDMPAFDGPPPRMGKDDEQPAEEAEADAADFADEDFAEEDFAEEPAVPLIAPEEPTTPPEMPIAAPEEPADAPEEPAAAPEEPPMAPEEPITAPEEPITAPEEPITAPEEPITAPEEPAAAPEEPAAPDTATAAPKRAREETGEWASKKHMRAIVDLPGDIFTEKVKLELLMKFL